jgi:hypothetical protein
MPPLALSDSQLAQVQAAAASLPRHERDYFLRRVARLLQRPPADVEVAEAIHGALSAPVGKLKAG